jgi:hypothetical protein
LAYYKASWLKHWEAGSQLGHWLLWLRFFMGFFSPLRRMVGYYLKLGHEQLNEWMCKGRAASGPCTATHSCLLCFPWAVPFKPFPIHHWLPSTQ